MVSEDSEEALVDMAVLVATEEAPVDSWAEPADTAEEPEASAGSTAVVPAVQAAVRAGNGEEEEARMCLC